MANWNGEVNSIHTSEVQAETQEYMQTAAVQSVIENGYGPEMIQRAIERLLMKEGIENLTGENILSAILSIEEEDEEEMKALHASRGEEITANGKEIDGHETEGFTNANEPSGDQETQERIMREYQELRNATLCKICLDNIICVVFLPCSHLVTCSSCATKVKECPICRALVKATAKAYFS